MGYRKLLKDYMSHIDAVVGSDLIELGALTNAFSKRDIGELRALAAELKRDVYTRKKPTNYDEMVRQLLIEEEINLEQLGEICGIEVGSEDEHLTTEQFRRILVSIVNAPKTASN